MMVKFAICDDVDFVVVDIAVTMGSVFILTVVLNQHIWHLYAHCCRQCLLSRASKVGNKTVLNATLAPGSCSEGLRVLLIMFNRNLGYYIVNW